MNTLEIKSQLRHLCKFSSPSGYEENISLYLGGIMSKIGFNVYSDAIGNIICQRKGKEDFRVMFIAHCDEVGFVVKYISDDGYVYFSNLGKTDVSLLYGRNVLISHEGDNVPGVIGTVPAHLGGNDVNNKDISNLWIDLGTYSKEETEHLVSIGDSITIQTEFWGLGNDMISSKALDNRSIIAALLDVCERIKEKDLPFNLYVVFSVQEEVGLVGSASASFAVKPNLCIALDVTHSTDIPGVDRRKYGDIRMNKGPVIPVGSNLSPLLQHKIRNIAKYKGIPFQIEALPGFSGTDIAQVQVTGSGCYTGLISTPCRYMHSPVETVSERDLKHMSQLIEALIDAIDASFVEQMKSPCGTKI